MTTKTTFTATAPDGSTHTRTSTHPYTHAVLCGPEQLNGKRDAGWGPWSFHASREQAVKAAKKALECYVDVVIVEVTA